MNDKEFVAKTGCSIPVVRLLWEQVDWVRFPAARPKRCLSAYGRHLFGYKSWESKGTDKTTIDCCFRRPGFRGRSEPATLVALRATEEKGFPAARPLLRRF